MFVLHEDSFVRCIICNKDRKGLFMHSQGYVICENCSGKELNIQADKERGDNDELQESVR